MKERLKLLESSVCTREGVLDFPSRTLVSSKTEVMDLLNKAIDQREEGLVLKDPDSIYKPNARKGGWLKVSKTDSVSYNLFVVNCFERSQKFLIKSES